MLFVEKFGFRPRLYVAVSILSIAFGNIFSPPLSLLQVESNMGNEVWNVVYLAIDVLPDSQAAWVSHLVSDYRNTYSIRDEKGRIGIKTLVCPGATPHRVPC